MNTVAFWVLALCKHLQINLYFQDFHYCVRSIFYETYILQIENWRNLSPAFFLKFREYFFQSCSQHQIDALVFQEWFSGLCTSLLQRIWWPSEALDYTKWAMDLQRRWLRWRIFGSRTMLGLAAIKLPRWGFRGGAIFGGTSPPSCSCSCSTFVQEHVSGLICLYSSNIVLVTT